MEEKGCENRKRNVALESRIFNNNLTMFFFFGLLGIVVRNFFLSSNTKTNFDHFWEERAKLIFDSKMSN